ncbi:MAG TPA: thioredoxin family protein [candidate division Zixibacteria bacterium]|nr:thioredoxin family protein [candidate division Zixibacteria bacterium]
MKPRTIEVFTAGCPVCSETLVLVKRVTKDCGCRVVEKKSTDKAHFEEAKAYGVKAMPAIVVDGVVVYQGQPDQKWAKTMLIL